MTTFKDLGLTEAFAKVLEEHGLTQPTEIQEKTIPLTLKGKDVIGVSATGSGKTLAFGSAIIEKCQPGKGIQALILSPTRELAEQISTTLKKFSKTSHLKIEEVYGGVSFSPQQSKLEKADIVVGTPGRILDHISQHTVNLSKVKFLVLDEADRMLDMGFIDDVGRIIKTCPKERQTFLFTATFSPDIEHISKDFLSHPTKVETDSYVDPTKLTQYYYDVPPYLKFSLLVHLLKEERSGLVMVFCNTRMNVDFLDKNLRRAGLNSTATHGGLSQNRRSFIMDEFHKNRVSILICTDVAARGLDIKNVSHVYNYDIPKNSTDYIHRIGRTARAGKEGKAISLVSNRDYENFQKVNEDDSLTITPLEVPQIEVVPIQRVFSSGRDRPRSQSRDYRGNSRSPSRGHDRERDDHPPRRSGGSRPHSRPFNNRSHSSHRSGGGSRSHSRY